VTFGYDLNGRVTTQTLPDFRVIQTTYDANGNVAYSTGRSIICHISPQTTPPGAGEGLVWSGGPGPA
jgi:YD repeat-containing protein